MRTSCFFLSICLLAGCTATGQPVNWQKVSTRVDNAARFNQHYKPAKALLIGTFHFDYPGLDGHKVDSSKRIDVLSPSRQKEVRQVADVIRQLRPTRVYVEVQESRQSWLDSLYTAYLQGTYRPGRNEVYQLGFRIAKEEGHSKVYAVDDGNFVRDNYRRFHWIDSLWSAAEPVDSVRDQGWAAFYSSLYKKEDSLTVHSTLLETLLAMMDRKALNKSHGTYVASGFNTKDDKGPDALAMWWYSRNLRVFNNILKTRPASSDRIVVIFGNGHMPILQHLFETSPEFELVELKTLVREAEKKGFIR